MNKDVTVKLNDAAPESTEVIAEAIVRLSQGVERLQKTGLNRRALLVLLKDASGVPHRQIAQVLDALSALQHLYVQAKPKAAARNK